MEMGSQLEYNGGFDASWFDSSLSSSSDPAADAAADSWFPNYGSFAYHSDPGSYPRQSSSTPATYDRSSTTHAPQLVHAEHAPSWASEISAPMGSHQSQFPDAFGSSWVSTSVSEASTPSAAKPDHVSESQGQRQPRIAQSSRKQKLLPRLSPVQVEDKPRSAHSVVERRYRGKLNDKIMQLHQALLTSQLTKRSTHAAEAQMSVHVSPHPFNSKIGKAGIMTMAIDYVQQADLQIQQLTEEAEQLRQRVAHLESLYGVRPAH